MRLDTSRFILQALLACGCLLQLAPASANTVLLLRENFNDVTGIPLFGERTVADILANDPGQLPAGTTVPTGSPNVRGVENLINLLPSPLGFNGFFTSNFLVLGDNQGPIPGNPSGAGDDTGVRFPFMIPDGAVSIRVAYRYAFEGIDTASNRMDQFIVRLNGPGDPVIVQELSSPGDFDEDRNVSFFDVFVDLDPATLGAGQYALVFRLNESGDGNGFTNTAVGIDRIRITAVPEPGSLLLLASGLLALAGWSLRKQR